MIFANWANAESMAALVQARFESSSYPTLRKLTCDWSGDTLTVRGRVLSFYQKQLVQSLLTELRIPRIELQVVVEVERALTPTAILRRCG